MGGEGRLCDVGIRCNALIFLPFALQWMSSGAFVRSTNSTFTGRLAASDRMLPGAGLPLPTAATP
jgi:hypothetical protein